MSDRFESFGKPMRSGAWQVWKRRLIAWGVLLAAMLVFVMLTWNAFFVYVRPGYHLVTITRAGKPLEPGQMLAEPGQMGVQRQVHGEGWHFVLPIYNSTEIEENTEIKAGEVGIVTAKGGKPLPPGRFLGEEGEQGIQRKVLLPGTYRINQRGFDVEIVKATLIEPGYVGVLQRMLGKKSAQRFAQNDDEMGIVQQHLQPGLYFLNLREYRVIKSETGIFQTTFHFDEDPSQNTAITFVSKHGLPISLDCTIEWEVRPEDVPALVAEYGSRDQVEHKVIEVQAHSIGRDKGINYGVQDFLEGNLREKFQEEFTKELVRVCAEKNVTINSAFIRNTVIPETYLKPIREKQIAGETELTNKAKELTEQSNAEVERESELIAQRVYEVEAETNRIVAGIDRDVENTTTKTEAEVQRLKADYQARIVVLESEARQVLGMTKAEAKKMTETAKSSLFKLKMDVFQNDNDAYLRYTMSQELNPQIVLRLFHAGSGTFWTNLGDKAVNLMLPAGAAPAAPEKERAGANNK